MRNPHASQASTQLLGVLMIVTGIGWLTYLAPNAAADLVPVNLIAGFLGEAAMILWLVVKGTDTDRLLRHADHA